MTKFEECAFQASDALNEATRAYRDHDFHDAASELRRAERELEAARAALAAAEAA